MMKGRLPTSLFALALVASACAGGAEASGIGPVAQDQYPSTVLSSAEISPVASARAPSSAVDSSMRNQVEGHSLVPFGGGTSDVGYNDGTLSVEAGEPGSVTLVDTPGQGPVGRPVSCTWHDIVGVGRDLSWDLEPTVPQPDGLYLLICVFPDDGSSVSGYPIAVEYNPIDPIPGGVVGVTEVAKFAIDSITFELPTAVLSPPGSQIVGVDTWLGVSSRLIYPSASAQAGNTWATVRPVLRDAVWDLGDGTTVNCATDIATTWDPAAPTSQSTTCSHVFESVSGPSLFAGRVDVSWTVYELTDLHPNTWTVWGVVSRGSRVGFMVGELQSVIR